MLILTIKTDNPEAEIGLLNDQSGLAYVKWQAHRALAESIHIKIKELLDAQNKDWHDLQGIVIYKGPGTFTGLRIGFSVANALAGSLHILVVATTGDSWQEAGIQNLLDGQDDNLALPDYGAEPNISTPKK